MYWRYYLNISWIWIKDHKMITFLSLLSFSLFVSTLAIAGQRNRLQAELDAVLATTTVAPPATEVNTGEETGGTTERVNETTTETATTTEETGENTTEHASTTEVAGETTTEHASTTEVAGETTTEHASTTEETGENTTETTNAEVTGSTDIVDSTTDTPTDSSAVDNPTTELPTTTYDGINADPENLDGNTSNNRQSVDSLDLNKAYQDPLSVLSDASFQSKIIKILSAGV